MKRAWKEGGCSNRRNCPFLHLPVCKSAVKGQRYLSGAECKYMHPTDIKQDESNNNSTAGQRRERPPRMQNSGGRRDPELVQCPPSQQGAAANRQPPWVQSQQAPAAQPQVWAHQQQSSNSPAAAPITAPTIDTAPFSAQSFLEKRLQEFKYGFLANLNPLELQGTLESDIQAS